jgi:hypothetical protein
LGAAVGRWPEAARHQNGDFPQISRQNAVESERRANLLHLIGDNWIV